MCCRWGTTAAARGHRATYAQDSIPSTQLLPERPGCLCCMSYPDPTQIRSEAEGAERQRSTVPEVQHRDILLRARANGRAGKGDQRRIRNINLTNCVIVIVRNVEVAPRRPPRCPRTPHGCTGCRADRPRYRSRLRWCGQRPPQT